MCCTEHRHTLELKFQHARAFSEDWRRYQKDTRFGRSFLDAYSQTPAGSSDDTLQKFQSITKNLQEQGLTPAIVRPVFEAVADDYPEMGEYLGDTATIVCSPDLQISV